MKLQRGNNIRGQQLKLDLQESGSQCKKILPKNYNKGMLSRRIDNGSSLMKILEGLKEENCRNNIWPEYCSISLLHYILYNSSKKNKKNS